MTIEEQIKQHAMRGSKNPRTRILIFVFGLTTVLALLAFGISAYLLWEEKQKQVAAGQAIIYDVKEACKDPQLASDLGELCNKADKADEVIKEGPPGPPGLQGPEGPSGEDGEDGKAGPRGPMGMSGPMGLRGLQGLPGKNGLNGLPGPIGPTGPVGPPGVNGTDGEKGEKGDKGEPGISAFPFTWEYTVRHNPGQSTTYVVTCTEPGAPCNTEEKEE